MSRFSRYERLWARSVGTLTFVLLVVELLMRGHA